MSTLIALGIILLFSGFAVSQVSYPDCTNATLAWSFNSFGQNPCAVIAYLQSTCWQGTFSVPPLIPGNKYSGMNSNAPLNLCYCNTITYSLISACGACQGTQWLSWSEWVLNCTQILPPTIFPNPVPAGIYVPHWSTLDITLENSWNMTNALAASDSPEIGPGQLVGGSGSSPTQTPAGTPTQSPPATPAQSQPATDFPATTTLTSKPNSPMPTSPTPSSSSTSAASLSRGKSSKTAPIVGGAIAGIAVIGIVMMKSEGDDEDVQPHGTRVKIRVRVHEE